VHTALLLLSKNLRCKNPSVGHSAHSLVTAQYKFEVRGEGLSGLDGLLTVVGLEVTMEGIRTGTSSERWKERVTDCRGCNDETAGTTELWTNCV